MQAAACVPAVRARLRRRRRDGAWERSVRPCRPSGERCRCAVLHGALAGALHRAVVRCCAPQWLTERDEGLGRRGGRARHLPVCGELAGVVDHEVGRAEGLQLLVGRLDEHVADEERMVCTRADRAHLCTRVCVRTPVSCEPRCLCARVRACVFECVCACSRAGCCRSFVPQAPTLMRYRGSQPA